MLFTERKQLLTHLVKHRVDLTGTHEYATWSYFSFIAVLVHLLEVCIDIEVENLLDLLYVNANSLRVRDTSILGGFDRSSDGVERSRVGEYANAAVVLEDLVPAKSSVVVGINKVNTLMLGTQNVVRHKVVTALEELCECKVFATKSCTRCTEDLLGWLFREEARVEGNSRTKLVVAYEEVNEGEEKPGVK